MRPARTRSAVTALPPIRPGGSGLLADHAGRVLVPAKPLEPRVPQLPGGRPLAERHLPDQARRNPVHAGAGQLAAAVERGPGLLQPGQSRAQARQQGRVEARADLARVDESAVGVVVTNEQCAEPGPRALGIGVAPDHEFLVVLALELEPVAGAP